MQAGCARLVCRPKEVEPIGRWLLAYAWLARELTLDDVARALDAENLLREPPMPLPGDACSFAWHLLVASGWRLAVRPCSAIEARARLQRISPTTFRRYLALVAPRG